MGQNPLPTASLHSAIRINSHSLRGDRPYESKTDRMMLNIHEALEKEAEELWKKRA